MSNDLAKKKTLELDGFEGYDDSVEGSDTPSRPGMGVKLKYIAPRWFDPNNEEFLKHVIGLDVLRRSQKWIDERPVETKTLGPGEPFPDVDALNEACPQNEWRDAFGKRVGPWANEHVVLFVDDNMQRYWWPSPVTTIGSAIAVRNLVEQTRLVRHVKRKRVYPVVKLSHTFMPTAYGDRERPDLVIQRWVELGPSSDTSLPPVETPPITGPAPTTETPTSATGAGVEMRTVEPPTLHEEMQDEIKF
jgi:hypothetical protein